MSSSPPLITKKCANVKKKELFKCRKVKYNFFHWLKRNIYCTYKYTVVLTIYISRHSVNAVTFVTKLGQKVREPAAACCQLNNPTM